MSDTRNITDKYKGWQEDLIKSDLKQKAFPYAVMMEHWGDFNLGTLIRNANAFGAQEVFYFGKRKWDKRGAVGTYKYTNLIFLETTEELLDLKSKYTIIGVDNVPDSVSITNFVWPTNPLLVFGDEGTGLSSMMQSHCQSVVEIPMYGSVRSLNCGTASGIVMHDFVSKLHKV